MDTPTPAPRPWLWVNLAKLIYDKDYAITNLRALIGAIGLGVATGVVPLPVVPDNTSTWYYVTRGIGLFLTYCAWKARGGDRTLHELNEATNEQLHVVGVATTTATAKDVAAAARTEGSVINEPAMSKK